MNAKVKEAMTKLEEGTRKLIESDKFIDYLNTMTKFHNYSFNNSMLIHLQNPNASYVAGFGTWKKLDRKIKAGEKGLQIFIPCKGKKEVENKDGEIEEKEFLYFKIGYVFDISQTEGKELPEIVNKLQNNVDDYDNFFNKLVKISPCPVQFGDTGEANGVYSKSKNTITIAKNLSEAQTIKTTIHEIAHSMMHSSDDSSKIDRRTKEVQAESVAYVVSNYFGLDTSDYSFGYVVAWSKDLDDFTELKQSMQIIQKTADKIIKAIEKV